MWYSLGYISLLSYIPFKMSIYILQVVVFGILLLLHELSPDHLFKLYFLLITTLTLSLVPAFRGIDVGADTFRYFEQFDNLATYVDYLEPGWLYINQFLKFIGGNFFSTLIVSSLIFAVPLVFLFYRHSKMMYLSVLLIMTYGLYLFHFNGIRQSLAISLLCFTYDYIRFRSFYKFLVVLICACFFHYTAFIFVFIYFAVTTSNRTLAFVWLLSLVPLFQFSLVAHVPLYLSEYIGGRYAPYFGSLFLECNLFCWTKVNI